MKSPRFLYCLGFMVLILAHSFGTPRLQAPVAEASLHLMPLPAVMAPADGKLKIDESFHAVLTAYTEPRLTRALDRFLDRLGRRTGLHFPGQPTPKTEMPQLVIECAGPGEVVQSIGANETYTLEISASKAKLAAPTPLGILHGLETILQLIDLDAESFYLPALTIQDRPRFPWRGLMIDVARHWQPIEVIKRNLDAMAAVKLNVFHWHLSDDQGFRVESKRFPKLQTMGSDGLFYTQDQLREVVAFARDRGIRVIPEFDMPGHTTAWFPAYPNLASAPGPYQIGRKWGVFDPVMDPTNKDLYVFLDSFLGEITPIFPDQYWHIGGDEVNGKQWNASARIAAFKKSQGMQNNEDLQAYFNKKLVALLNKHGKKAIGWDEILHPDLPRTAVIQSWRGQDSLAQGAQKGFSGILSSGYYIDHLLSAGTHYQVDPLGQKAASLSEEQKALILGGEACMWGEYITFTNIDSRIWPRMAAIAERFWSPASVKDVDDMYRRLPRVSRELEYVGVTHNANYPQMLQRMMLEPVPDTLETLGNIVESVKRLGRARLRNYTSFTPMNRLTDAVPPESETARIFNRNVDLALVSPSALQAQTPELRAWLTRWRDNHAALVPVLRKSYLLRELEPLSENVAALATTGLQALGYLNSGKKPPETWTRDAGDLLKRVDRQEAEALIMVIPGIRKLIVAANQLP
jgi:hexosaminidase